MIALYIACMYIDRMISCMQDLCKGILYVNRIRVNGSFERRD